MTTTEQPMTLFGRLMVACIALAILGGLLYAAKGLLDSAPNAKRISKPREARLVEVAQLKAQDHPIELSTWGQVIPAEQVVLRAPLAGSLVHIAADLAPGQVVRQGQILFKIDDRDLKQSLLQRKAELAKAQAELALENGNQANARAEYQLSGKQLSDEKKQWVLRQPQLAIAKANVAAASAAVEAVEVSLSRISISAPFDAVVVERHVSQGSYVNTGADLVTLIGTHDYWVKATLPMADLPWISSSTDSPVPATLNYPAVWGDKTRQGQLLNVLPSLQSDGKLAQLLIQVRDPLALNTPNAPSLLLDTYLQVRLTGHTLKQAFQLPRAWLRLNDQVWLYGEDQRLVIQDVTIAYRDQQFVYITAGLTEQDRIIASDLSVYSAGMLLRVNTPSASKQERGASDER